MESNARAESVARQRIRYAGFPSIKTITDFDFTAKPAVDRVQIAGLEGGGWLAEARNIVLLGPPGTGKNASGDCAGNRRGPRRTPRVAFASATGWITRLAEAHRIDRLDAELRKISRYGLIVIDEVGYIPFDYRWSASQVVICARELKPSFVRMCSTCVSAVRSEMTKDVATSLFDMPAATRSATSRSRGVS